MPKSPDLMQWAQREQGNFLNYQNYYAHSKGNASYIYVIKTYPNSLDSLSLLILVRVTIKPYRSSK